MNLTSEQFYNLFPPIHNSTYKSLFHKENNYERLLFVKQKFEQKIKVRLLYHYDYWDGPLSGICTFNNQKYFFSNIYDCYYDERFDGQEDEYGDRNPCYHRIHLAYQMPKEYKEAEEKYSNLFIEHFGSWNCYDENNKRTFKNPLFKGLDKPYVEIKKIFDSLDEVKNLIDIKINYEKDMTLSFWFTR